MKEEKIDVVKRSRCLDHIKLNEKSVISSAQEDSFNLTLGEVSPQSTNPNNKRRRKFHRISLSMDQSKSNESSPYASSNSPNQYKFFPSIHRDNKEANGIESNQYINCYPIDRENFGNPLSSTSASYNKHFDFDIKSLNRNKVKLKSAVINSVCNYRNTLEVFLYLHIEIVRRFYV